MAINRTKKETEKQNYEIKVTRVKAFEDGGIRFDMVVNGVTIYNMSVVKSKDGNEFLSFPSRKDSKSGKYFSHCYFPIDEELQKDIEKQIESLL